MDRRMKQGLLNKKDQAQVSRASVKTYPESEFLSLYLILALELDSFSISKSKRTLDFQGQYWALFQSTY